MRAGGRGQGVARKQQYSKNKSSGKRSIALGLGDPEGASFVPVSQLHGIAPFCPKPRPGRPGPSLADKTFCNDRNLC